MCFAVTCSKCGKAGWGGCGKHLPGVYAGIQTGNHCFCRPWPGVAMPSRQQSSQQSGERQDEDKP